MQRLQLLTGSAVSWDGRFNTATEDQVFSNVIDFVFNCACFIYIGAWLPFQLYNAPEVGLTPWKLVVLFLFILAMRRIPCLMLLYNIVPDIRDLREALFCGHFGMPLAIFYWASLTPHRTDGSGCRLHIDFR